MATEKAEAIIAHGGPAAAYYGRGIDNLHAYPTSQNKQTLGLRLGATCGLIGIRIRKLSIELLRLAGFLRDPATSP